MNDALKTNFPPFTDEQSLRAAIESVCARFGSVKSLRILPAAREERLRCACLLRLDSPAAELALKSALHVGEFYPDIAFMADVDEAWTGPRMIQDWMRCATPQKPTPDHAQSPSRFGQHLTRRGFGA
jgi:hypothetical protein